MMGHLCGLSDFTFVSAGPCSLGSQLAWPFPSGQGVFFFFFRPSSRGCGDGGGAGGVAGGMVLCRGPILKDLLDSAAALGAGRGSTHMWGN